jgi:hypothetical protein
MTKAIIGNETVMVDDTWEGMRESIGYGGMDVAAYICGGMSIWPCGRTFQEGGRDGFEEDVGENGCECKTCNKVRNLLFGS